MSRRKRKALYFGILLLCIALLLYLSSSWIMIRLGEFLVLDEEPVPSDAVVVLCTGVEYYPRLIEGAELFKKGFARNVVINGNRKTDVMRSLEEKGFERCCPWYEESLRILSMFGVPKDQVMHISAEDAYDTVSEADIVGREILQREFTKIIIATSKFHTRRARFIWNKRFGDRLSICTVSAKTDPFDPKSWWKEGRQIRWVLAEYGAWIYYWWKT